jgi:hypothetical protein
VITNLAMGRERQLAVKHWLLSAAQDAHRVQQEWDERHMAMLSCGTLFAAVRIPAAIVQAAGQSTDLDALDRYLAEALLDGPVICDQYAGWYYALVPASTAGRWDVPDSTCLGVGSTLGVPRPGMRREDRARVYWSVPMDSAGMLCSPHAVSMLQPPPVRKNQDRGGPHQERWGCTVSAQGQSARYPGGRRPSVSEARPPSGPNPPSPISV